jgi:adenine-specific DNA-methyltransferase
VSNDAELYSYYITKAFALSQWSEKLKNIIDSLNNSKDGLAGFVTKNFSPWKESERMFFTVENAQRIDWCRQYIENIRPNVTEAEYVFLVASLVVSADAVSNLPAVYGMYLKNFKDKAKKKLVIRPIHTNQSQVSTQSQVFNSSVLNSKFPKMDAVYLDPPYNGRQYSKNYFPLNIIAMTPEIADGQQLHGKTGIPDDSFISTFCQKKSVEQSFETLVKTLDTQWIFISYNSESLITKDRMIQILSKYGETGVEEMDYKRFKSFSYNDGDSVTEYLFFLRKL